MRLHLKRSSTNKYWDLNKYAKALSGQNHVVKFPCDKQPRSTASDFRLLCNHSDKSVVNLRSITYCVSASYMCIARCMIL